MAGLSTQALTLALFQALESCGAQPFLIKSNNPRLLEFYQDGAYHRAKVYIWTLTHGGGAARPEQEMRIQITLGADRMLDPSGAEFALLMGYEPNLRVFAGFDICRHTEFGFSPSIQIPKPTLNSALEHGLAFHRRQNGETGVAIRPDMLVTYILSSSELHQSAKSNAAVAVLNDATSTSDLIGPPAAKGQRARVAYTVSRACRDARFRKAVLQAYDYRCAVSRFQLDLVQAAHIVPVADPEGEDKVQNGIALSPTYHLAFDSGLIYLEEDFRMLLNQRRVEELASRGWIGGLESFKTHLGRIHLPPQKDWFPSIVNIRKAKKLRLIY